MSPDVFILSGALRGFEQTEPKSQVQGAGLFGSSPQESPHPPVRSWPLLASLLSPPGSPYPDPVLSFLQTQNPQLPTQLSVPPLLASEEKKPLPRICPLP